MAKPKHKEVKFSAKEMAEDVPGELDFSRLRLIGRGKDAIFGKPKTEKTVSLDPDVAEVFPDSKAVNQALRSLIKIARTASGHRKKSA